MGQEQSKSEGEQDTQPADDDLGNHPALCEFSLLTSQEFDLDAIEDNRQYLPKSSSPLNRSTPVTDARMARRSKKGKRKKKNNRKQSVQSEDIEEEQPAANYSESPVDEEKLQKTLSQREPEQFHLYESASDKSDEEQEAEEVVEFLKSRRVTRAQVSESVPDGTTNGVDFERNIPTPADSEADDKSPDELWSGSENHTDASENSANGGRDPADVDTASLEPEALYDATANTAHGTDLRCPFGCVRPKTKDIMTFASVGTRNRHVRNQHTEKERATARMILTKVRAEGTQTRNERDGLEDAAQQNEATAEVAEVDPKAKALNRSESTRQLDETDSVSDGDEAVGQEQSAHASDVEAQGRSLAAARFALNIDAGDDQDFQTRTEDLDDDGQSEQTDVRKSKKRKRHEQSFSTRVETEASTKRRKHDAVRASDPPGGPAENHVGRSTFIGVFVEPRGTLEPDKPLQYKEPRQSSMSTFAQPYTAGSKLRHPLFHPESPDKRKRARDASSEVEQKQDIDQGKQLRKKQKSKQTTTRPVSRKGKERAVSDEPAGDEPLPPNDATNLVLDKSASKSKRKFPDRDASDQEPEGHGTSDDDGSSADRLENPAQRFTCRVCKRKYQNERRLNSHLKKPKAHMNLLKCEDCKERFYHIKALTSHTKATGHGQEVEVQAASGRFTGHEEAAMRRWVSQFCDIHDLNREDFNEMMQASFRRGSTWSYDFISKQDFVDEYFDVLPHRNKQSMVRYRTANFNNTNSGNVWSKEEDDEIVRLHQELGSVWRRIGQELGRPGEKVRQRWKRKLQCAKQEHGNWTRPEDSAFLDAIEDIKAVSGAPTDSFNWTAVSKLVGTRTPQQCANHWRGKYAGIKRGDKWLSLDAYGTPATTPLAPRSRMEQRLAGKLSASPRKSKIVSKKHIEDSSDGDEEETARGNHVLNEGRKPRQPDVKKPRLKQVIPTPKDKNEPDDQDVMRPPESGSDEDDTGSAVDNSPDVSNSNAESDDSQDEDDDNRLPRNPLVDITPGKTLTASQVFAQTQANTSAKRPSPRKGSLEPSRPSPPITIQRQRVQSPELGTPDPDVDETGSEESDDDDKENMRHLDGQVDTKSTSGDEENEDEHQVKDTLIDSEAEDSTGSDADSESEDDKGSTELESDSAPALPSRGSRERSAEESTSRTTTTTESEADSASDSDSEETSEPESDPTSPILRRKEAASKKSLAQVSNDFLNSIHETSQKRKQRRLAARRADESSDED